MLLLSTLTFSLLSYKSAWVLLAEIKRLLFFDAFQAGGWDAAVFMDVLTP